MNNLSIKRIKYKEYRDSVKRWDPMLSYMLPCPLRGLNMLLEVALLVKFVYVHVCPFYTTRG